MIKVINVTDIQNGKQALLYVSYSCVYLVYLCLVSPFEWRIYTIDSCWYRQLIPLTHAQNAHVSLPSAVVCVVCSSAAFWSDVADAKRQHRRLSSPLVLWSRLGVSWPWWPISVTVTLRQVRENVRRLKKVFFKLLVFYLQHSIIKTYISVSPAIILGGRPALPTAPPAPLEGQVNFI